MRDFNLVAMLLRVPPLLFALTVHEFAHAWVAWRCGDPTAKMQGRLSFNPLVHLDPIGALCLLFAPIGWAKPVPVNPYNFRHPRRDDILVSLAGVAVNMATAIAVAILLRLAWAAGIQPLSSRALAIVWVMLYELCLMSIGLAIFNLIPIPPLDGSHVLQNMLPYEQAVAYRRLAPITSMVFLVLVVSGAISNVIFWPVIHLARFFLGDTLLFGSAMIREFLLHV